MTASYLMFQSSAGQSAGCFVFEGRACKPLKGLRSFLKQAVIHHQSVAAHVSPVVEQSWHGTMRRLLVVTVIK